MPQFFCWLKTPVSFQSVRSQFQFWGNSLPVSYHIAPDWLGSVERYRGAVWKWDIYSAEEFLSHHPGNLYSLARSPSVSGIPASRQVNPFLQLGLLALHPRSLIGHKLPYWAVTIRPSPSIARFQRLDHAVESTDHLTPFLLEAIPQNSLPVQALPPIAFGLFGFWWHPQKLSMAESLPVWCTQLI